jgi:small conductance mechanosensitive channel
MRCLCSADSRGEKVDSNKLMTSFTRLAALMLALLLIQPVANAETKYVATTANNVDISTDDLTSLLLPLTQSQLVAEAAAWQSVLQQKVAELSKLEVQNRNSGSSTGLIGEVGTQLKDGVSAVLPAVVGLGEDAGTADASNNASADAAAAAAETDAAEKPAGKDLASTIAVMRVEQGGINKRFAIVLDALESKGGDVKEQRLYLAAVSGIKLKVDDTSAALLAAREWLKSKDGGQLLLINLLQFLAVVAVVLFASRLLGKLTDRLIARRPTSRLLENFIRVGVRRGVIAIGILAALPIIGIDVGPVLALIGAAGLVIGLALQGTLSNFASGVLILVYRPYDMNDAISVAGVSGVVSNMNLLYTTIKTFDNQLITIPNNNVWNDTIINITGSHERRVDLIFGISYADDFGRAQDILRAILAQHPKVLETPAPNIRLHELADSSVRLICRPWAKTEDYWDVYWDVTEAVKREFDKQGISIPFPRQDVHVYAATALPEVKA